MKNTIQKFKYIIFGVLLVIGATVVQAVQISVPSGNGSGFLLQSGTSGNYNAVSLTAGSNVTIATTTSNITISATGGGSGFGEAWTLGTNIFSQSMLAPTTTQNIHVSGTGTSTFVGGLEAWRQLASPYFYATSTTATSTIRNALQIGTTAGDNALKVDASGRIYPASVSVGGAINCNEGTQGQFPCLVLYGNSGSAGTGRMFSVMQEGTAVTQDMMFASSSGANVTAFNIKGMPTGKGILKIEATGSGTGYANSSAISLDLGNETDAQGIFIKGAVNGTSKLTTWVDSNSSTLGFFDPNGLFNSKYSSSTVYSSFLTASSTFLNAGSFTLATTSAGCASITNVGLLFSTGVACGGSFSNTIANGGTGSTSFAPNSIITSNAAGTALIATTSTLYVTNLLATSTTATSTFNGNVLISPTNDPSFGFNSWQPFEIVGNTSNPFQDILVNKSAGAQALGCRFMANDKFVNGGFASQYYGGLCIAGSNYNTPGANAVRPNGVASFASDGPYSLGSAATNSASSTIFFQAGSGLDVSYDAALMGGLGNFILGTTTLRTVSGIANYALSTAYNNAKLWISSSTIPQLALEGGDADNIWNFRAVGNQFFLATSSPTTYATSSTAALRIDANGKVIANCFSTDGTTCLSGTGGAGTVTSVGITSTNSTLTFGSTPITTSGTFTADLNLGHANTWTAAQTFSGGLMVATTTQWMNSIATLVGTTTIQGQINSIFASTTGSATQNINWSSGNTQRIIINAATNIVINATSSNPIDGGKYVLKICQDPVGSRAITFVTPGQLRWWNGTTTISSAANTCTFIGMIYDDLYQKYSIIASSTGVSLN